MWHYSGARIIDLLETYLATEAYLQLPIKRYGFRLDTVVIGENGKFERFVNAKQLHTLETIAQNNNLAPLFKKFEKYEKSVFPLFKKDFFEERKKLMTVFQHLWVHEITGYFVGLYVKDAKTIDIISRLRGTKNAQHVAVFNILPKLLNQISEKTGVDAELLKYAMPGEIISLKLNTKVLKLRKKFYVLKTSGQSVRLLIGNEAKKLAKRVKEESDFHVGASKDITEIKGNIGFIGKVYGKVIIVRRDSDISKVKKGDILVSVMTRTSFILAMQRAAAFVTDEGGLTSHAAILARELAKPCIIGTKIATQVLKDGDEVEVDANKGIVKILRRG